MTHSSSDDSKDRGSNESDKWVEVGFVKDAHGIAGELYIHLFADQVDWLKKQSKIHLRRRGASKESPRSFTIKNLRPHRHGFIVCCEELADRNQAENLKAMTYVIPTETLISAKGETIYLHELLNFRVEDPAGKNLGQVVGFLSHRAQDSLKVEGKNGVAEIPLVLPFIIAIDYDRKTIVMDLPEGLI